MAFKIENNIATLEYEIDMLDGRYKARFIIEPPSEKEITTENAEIAITKTLKLIPQRVRYGS